jgi:IS5 family transposase
MHLIKIALAEDSPAVMPFVLMRDHVKPSLEARRKEIESMYSPVIGRPETDPALLLGITVLQILANLPDRACTEACLYDARWRLALGEIPAFHPTTLVKFRNRIALHGKTKIALESCLNAMQDAGYLKSCKSVRIDSTHLLGRIADMSRLECVRETLRLALEFLAEHQSSVGSDCPPPTEVFVDAGYVSAPALIKAEAAGYTLTGPMPAPPNSKSRFGTDSFIINIPGRMAVCPAGHTSSECSRIDDAKYAQYGIKYFFAWPRKTCASCPLREQCLSKKNKLAHRTIEVNEHHMTVQARRNLCKTQDYQDHMHKRSAIEGSHSELVRGYGLRDCRYKGRLKTDLQSQFTATACNLRRWARRLCWEERKMA